MSIVKSHSICSRDVGMDDSERTGTSPNPDMLLESEQSPHFPAGDVMVDADFAR